jgi:zinc transport system permease protein
MAGLAALAGALSVLGGIGASLIWDTPAGPSIVVAATVLFVASLAGHALRAAPSADRA